MHKMKIIQGFDKAKPLFTRQGGPGAKVNEELEKIVRQIVDDVRQQGDKALFSFTEKFDGVKLTVLEIGKKAIERLPRDR